VTGTSGAGGAVANGSIYFRVGGGGPSRIDAVEPDGTGRRVVFDTDPARIAQIAWSPDGRRIAYQNPIAAERGIYVANADGSESVRLTDGINDAWPSWSPDGTKIVFSSSRSDPSIELCEPAGADFMCPTDIYVMNADGSPVVRLTTDESPEYQPDWSPDGSRIAFVRVPTIEMQDEIVTAPRIFTMNPDGSDVRQVSSGDGGSDFSPSWSIDSAQLAFAAIRREDWGIWVVDADGSNEHLVLGSGVAGHVEDPVWSPDGTMISFVGNLTVDDYSPDDALYVMRPDGTGITPLADAPGVGVAGDIAWRPVPAPAVTVEPTFSPPTAEVVRTFDVATSVTSVAYGEGSVWVAAPNNDGSFGGRIIRIDPVTHQVQAEIPVDVIPTWEVGGGAMVVLPGSLWVTGSIEAPGAFDDPGGGADAAVIRIDTATNEVVETFGLGGTHGADLTFQNGELWVLLFGDETVNNRMEVVRVHSTGTVLNRIPLSTSWAHTIAAAGGRLVVYEGGNSLGTNVDGHLVAIDPETKEVAERADVPGRYFEGGPVVWRGQVWAALDDGFTLFEPVAGQVIEGSPELDASKFVFCCGFVEADDRGIWFLGLAQNGTDRQLNLFDPATGEVTELLELDEGSPVAMAIAPDAVWILNYEGTLTRIDLIGA
jgi:Tol biopolymer transport system component